MPKTRTCRVCGAEKPAALVRETVLGPIDPLETAACVTCEHVQNHSLDDDRCAQCGESLDGAGFGLELEYPLGAADLPAFISVSLCGDCASWIACDIAYRGVDADEEASDRFSELIERERTLELEGSA